MDSVEMAEKQKRFILQDNLWRVMIDLSWPAVIAMVLYGGNSMLDAYFVGKYVGESGLAGVSLAYPVTQISTGVGSLIGVGAGAVLSIAIGAKDKKTQRNIIPGVNILTVISTIIYMIVGLIFSTALVKMMGGAGEELAIGDEYFKITVYGAIFWIYGLAINMIIRAEGRMKKAAWMMGIGLLANAVFNYIFIVIMKMGVTGAAWGTNVGMLVYSLVGIIYLKSGKASFESNPFSFKSDKTTVSDINRLGISSFIMTVMTLIQAIVIFNALAKYGTMADIAFYGVVYRLFQFFLTPIFGLMRALQPVIGINYGAKRYDRVIKSYKIFTVAAMILTIPLWLITLISPEGVLSLMLTEQVMDIDKLNALRIYILIVPVLSSIFMAMTFFPAVDKGKPAAIIGMVRQFIFYIPAMIFVPKFFGINSIYYASFVIDVVVVLGTIVMVKKEFNSLNSRGDIVSNNEVVL